MVQGNRYVIGAAVSYTHLDVYKRQGEFPLEDFYAGLDENVNDRNSIKVIIHPNTEE